MPLLNTHCLLVNQRTGLIHLNDRTSCGFALPHSGGPFRIDDVITFCDSCHTGLYYSEAPLETELVGTWLQVATLIGEIKTVFVNSLCLGNAWAYYSLLGSLTICRSFHDPYGSKTFKRIVYSFLKGWQRISNISDIVVDN